jgi:hypothetical protein
MFVNTVRYGYSNKKYVSGRGLVDSMSSAFSQIGNAFKSSAGTVFKSIGSYLSKNKDLIAKPILGAVGSLGAAALTAGVPAAIAAIQAIRNKKQLPSQSSVQLPAQSPVPMPIPENVKYKEILKNILDAQSPSMVPVTNIIGSGIKSF